MMGILLASALLLFTQTSTILAAPGSIGVIPAFPQEGNERSKGIFIYSLKGGESAEDGVKIFNYTDAEVSVILGAVDSIAASDGSFSCKQNTDQQKVVGTWVELTADKVTIPAKSDTIVPFTVNVPKDVSPGEYDGCVTAQDASNFATKKGSGILLGFRSAIRMAITVPGKIVKKLTIEQVKIERVSSGNYTVSPITRNSGNVSLDVTTRVQLQSLFRQKTPIKTANYPVIRGATTGWPFEFKRPFWGGIFRAYTSVSYNANPADGLGVNTADQKKLREDTGYFVMAPTPAAIGIGLAVPVATVLAMVFIIRRRRFHKTVASKWERYTSLQNDTIVSIATERNIRWKKLARINHIKPPYTIAPGQLLHVPPLKQKKGKNKEIGNWLVDDTPLYEKTTSQEETPIDDRNGMEKSLVQSGQDREIDNESNISTPHNVSTLPTEINTHMQQSPPTYPRSTNAAFPEPEDVDPVPNWRDGADENELRKLGIEGADAVAPRVNSSWSIDEDVADKRVSKPKKTKAKKTTKQRRDESAKSSAAKKKTK